MSEVSRITGVFFEPKKTFMDIAARPTWILPVLLSVIISLIGTYLISTHIGWERIAAQQIASSSASANMPADQRQRSIEMGAKLGGIFGYGISLIGPPLITVIIAAVMMAMVAGILSTPVKFKQMMAAVAWSSLPRVLMGVLLAIVVCIKNPDDFNIKNPLMFNPGAFMDPAASSKFLYSLATSLDLFTFWIILLLATGIKAAGGKKISFGGALFAVLLPWALVVLAGASIAGMMG